MRYNTYYSERELQEMGFKELGGSVLISRKCSILTPWKISIGSHVLISDYTVLDGPIIIGDHVRISFHCELFAGEQAPITMSRCTAMSSHCSIYAVTEDYAGPYLFNPTVPRKYRNLIQKEVTLEQYVLIGTHSVVLPGVRLGEGCTFGSMSLINRSTEPGGLYVTGADGKLRRIRERDLDEIRAKGRQLADDDARKARRSVPRATPEPKAE